MNIFHHIYQSTIAAAVLFFTATSLAHADPTISLHQLERLSNKNYRLRIDRNKIEFNHLELKKLKDESSVELQTRVKGGIYQHFSYDGINKHYITRPALGIKYYLFGGNKYQRHIIDKAEPKYYESISFLDAARRQIRSRLEILYTKYWKYGTDYSEVGKIIALLERQSQHIKDPLQALITRVRMRQYLSKMQKREMLSKIRELSDKQIPSFHAILPKPRSIARHQRRSIFYHHPGLEGLINYYRTQKKLGWLRFADLKFKLFARPSYYPSAGKTKMAVIGGVYLTMPLNIFGAAKKQGEQLSIDRQNILLRLSYYRNRHLHQQRVNKIKYAMQRKEYIYWKGVASRSVQMLRHALSMSVSSVGDINKIKKLVRTYRQATLKWVSARSSMSTFSTW